MGRLFEFNEALNIEHAGALEVLAGDIKLPRESVYIGNGASGPAVFYEEPSGNTLCACSVDSDLWLECQARAVLKSLLSRL